MEATETTRPSRDDVRKLIAQHPYVTNTEWGKMWGISRERVRQLRKLLGLPPSADMQRKKWAAIKYERIEARRQLAKRNRPDPCPVCNGPVSMLRKVTCSPGCAQHYERNSKYRYRPRNPRD